MTDHLDPLAARWLTAATAVDALRVELDLATRLLDAIHADATAGVLVTDLRHLRHLELYADRVAATAPEVPDALLALRDALRVR